MADHPDRWSLIDELFHAASSLPPDERLALLRARAAHDPSLIADVQSLIAADARTHTLLDAPRPAGLPTGLRLGPYALDRVLGAGGMATVYLAHRADHQFDKHVAIKLVNQGVAAALSGGRFETEQRVLARLEHPNIARLLDAGLNEFGQPYLVMEWVDGVTLDRWLSEQQPSPSRRFDLWLELASAVAYAHRNLIVHRDIKPSNVLVGRDGTPKLVDFGIAKLIEEDGDEQTRTIHFTPRSASPEQLTGAPVTTAADVFGLGVLLCEMLTGRHPFGRDGDSPHEHARSVLIDDPVLPTSLDADLKAIIGVAVRKEPERRYASVAAFADDVTRYRRGLPVAAHPESYRYRARKFVRRHRIGFAAATLAAIATTSAAALYARQARIAARERDRANVEAEKTVQVNRFLQEMLSAADPTKDGRDVKVVDLLDRAGERLGSELRGQADIEADLRSTLAATYQSLGVFDSAIAHRRRALELREQALGPEDITVATSRIDLGDALYARGEYVEAEQVLRRALNTLARTGHDQSVEGATGRRYLAEVLNEVGQVAEAETLHREAIALYRRLLPADDERVAGTLNDLGVLLGTRQDWRQAEPLHREALAIMRRVHGPEHLLVAQTLNNLAGVIDGQKRYEEAEPLYLEALAIQLKLLGEDHDRVILTRTSLANMLWMKREYGRAESIARTALASAERGLPNRHPLTAYAHLELGQILSDAGRPAEGEPHLRAALEMRRAVLPPGHWLVANTESVLGGCIAAQRRFAEAEPLLVSSYQRLLTDRGPTHDKTRDARRRLVELYTAWNRPRDAARFSAE